MLDQLAIRRNGQGFLSAVNQLLLQTVVESHPHVTLSGFVAPVAVDRCAGTLSAAHQKEPARIASAVLLWRVIQRDVPLKSLSRRFHEVDSVLVGAGAIAELAV